MATTYTPNNSYTINTTSGLTVGGTISTAAINGTSWATNNSKFYSSNQTALLTIPHGEEKVVLEKAATLEVKGNVVINGIDLEERLSVIERVLAIPARDATIEAKYPSLKKKFDDYINSLEKYKTFERIKGDDE